MKSEYSTTVFDDMVGGRRGHAVPQIKDDHTASFLPLPSPLSPHVTRHTSPLPLPSCLRQSAGMPPSFLSPCNLQYHIIQYHNKCHIYAAPKLLILFPMFQMSHRKSNHPISSFYCIIVWKPETTQQRTRLLSWLIDSGGTRPPRVQEQHGLRHDGQ